MCGILAVIIFLPAAKGAGFRWTRASWCRAALAVLCLYIGTAAAVHHKAFSDVEQFAATQHLQVENFAALPLPPTLTHWVGLVSTPQGVWRTTFHEPGGAVETSQFYADAQSRNLIEEARNLRDVQVFLWFARYPVWRVRQGDGQTVVEIFDVRFFRENTSEVGDPVTPTRMGSAIRRRGAGFTFRVIFNSAGQIISHGFREAE